MPNWSPNWNDVHWDWGAADAATSALRRAADRLESMTYDRKRVATEAQQEWRGRYRNEFDEELRNILRRSRDLANGFRQAAERISRSSHRAWEEQRHRESERERWWREKREEDERRRREEERRRRGGE